MKEVVIDTPAGQAAIVSSPHAKKGMAYVIDQTVIFGPFYDPEVHGPPLKIVVHDDDAEKFVTRMQAKERAN